MHMRKRYVLKSYIFYFSHFIGRKCTYKFFSGLTGSYCEIDVDECIPIPNQPPICAHGGKCVNTFGSYHCQCAPGYKGEFCDDNVDDCQPNPCYNGGSCIDGDNSFQCSCTEGNCIFQVLFRKLRLILVITNISIYSNFF